MTTLLICGSRDTNPEMVSFAQNCARRAVIDNAWHVITGDSLGVDQAVAAALEEVRVDLDGEWWIPLRVFGLSDAPRHGITSPSVDYTKLSKVRIPYVTGSQNRRYVRVGEVIINTYRLRDEYMVNQVDMIMCIWNGRSNGTKHVFDYALSRGFVPDENLWIRSFREK